MMKQRVDWLAAVYVAGIGACVVTWYAVGQALARLF
jgi:hypothetical protein